MEYSSVQPLDGDMFAARLSLLRRVWAEMCAGQFEDLQLPHVMGVEGVGVLRVTGR